MLEFETPFWEKTHPDLGFLFTDDAFTFWTQLHLKRPILVGWIGNDKAGELGTLPDATLVSMLLSKLAPAFAASDVNNELRASKVFRYTKQQSTKGAYSWTMPQSRNAIAQINRGIDNTIWFAGEAFQRNADVGTVEAALQSGRYIARKILRSK